MPAPCPACIGRTNYAGKPPCKVCGGTGEATKCQSCGGVASKWMDDTAGYVIPLCSNWPHCSKN